MALRTPRHGFPQSSLAECHARSGPAGRCYPVEEQMRRSLVTANDMRPAVPIFQILAAVPTYAADLRIE